jgi:hypothetical protein
MQKKFLGNFPPTNHTAILVPNRIGSDPKIDPFGGFFGTVCFDLPIFLDGKVAILV